MDSMADGLRTLWFLNMLHRGHGAENLTVRVELTNRLITLAMLPGSVFTTMKANTTGPETAV